MDGRLVVGAAGGSGAGKSTIIDLLEESLNTKGIPHSKLSCDSYYKGLPPSLSEEEIANYNFDHPDSLDWELFVLHVEKLKNGETIEAPIYDFGTHSRVEGKTKTVQPGDVIFLDGILIFHPEILKKLIDLKVFVKADEETFKDRRINRDIKERGRTRPHAEHQFETTVRPMYKEFVAPTAQIADFVFDNDKALSKDAIRENLKPLLEEILKKLHLAKAAKVPAIYTQKQATPLFTGTVITPHALEQQPIMVNGHGHY